MSAQLHRLVAVVVVATTLLGYPGISLAKQTTQKAVAKTKVVASTKAATKAVAKTIVNAKKQTTAPKQVSTTSVKASSGQTTTAVSAVASPVSSPQVAAQTLVLQSAPLLPQDANAPQIKVVASVSLGPTSTVSNGQTFDFGNVDFEGYNTSLFRIYNIGNSDLHISQAPTISGPDAANFKVIQPMASLLIAPGTRQYLTLSFTPTTLGVKHATLTIQNDDPNQSPYVIPLTGTGVNVQSIMYEDAEGGTTSNWRESNDSGKAMSIANVADDVNHGKAIEIAASDYMHQDYQLTNHNLSSWWYNNSASMRRLKFDLKTVNDINAMVLVYTQQNTFYFLMYSFDNPNSGLVNNRYAYIHLDPALKDGQWHTITRDLTADFAALVPGQSIHEVDYFALGSSLARVDNILLTKDAFTAYQVGGAITDNNNAPLAGVTVTMSPFGQTAVTNEQGLYAFPGISNGNYTITPSAPQYDFAPASRQVTVANGNMTSNFTGTVRSESVYEDAEDGSVARWVSAGSVGVNSISNVVDGNGGHNHVIEIQDSDYYNYNYTLKAANGVSSWHNTTAKTFSFDVKTQGDFRTFVRVTTDQGDKYFMYSFSPVEGPFAGRYYGFSLSPILKDGAWHTIVRDLAADVAVAFPGATIQSVEEFVVGGTSMRVDNVKLTTQNLIYSISGSVVDGNNQPLSGVSITIGAQTVTTDQNGNYTFPNIVAGSYTVNASKPGYIFSPSDTNVTVVNSSQVVNFVGTVQNTFVYEDGGDGGTSKWQFLGGTGVNSITNVMDDQDHSNVIEIASTDPVNNNYQLGDKAAGVAWNNTIAKTLKFDFKTTDDFSAFAEVTVNGQTKYVMYSSNRPTGVLLGRYASIRIDPALKDGAWHTVTRDLTADLQSLFPGEEITAVNSFIFGAFNGRVDNVMLSR